MIKVLILILIIINLWIMTDIHNRAISMHTSVDKLIVSTDQTNKRLIEIEKEIMK